MGKYIKLWPNCKKKEEKSGPNFNGHEYVDLGLPSGKLWSVEVFNVDLDLLEMPNIKDLLGGGWRLPTEEEYQELIDNTLFDFYRYETNPFHIYSEIDHLLILPYYYSPSNINNWGMYGNFISSTPNLTLLCSAAGTWSSNSVTKQRSIVQPSSDTKKFGIIGIIG